MDIMGITIRQPEASAKLQIVKAMYDTANDSDRKLLLDAAHHLAAGEIGQADEIIGSLSDQTSSTEGTPRRRRFLRRR